MTRTSEFTRVQPAQQTGQRETQQPPPRTPGGLFHMRFISACNIKLKDDGATLPWVGRSDYSADETLEVLRFVETPVLSGIAA